MTDFVVSAKLIGDASDMVGAAGQGVDAMGRLGRSATEASAAGGRLGRSAAEQRAQLQANAAAINQVVRATNPAVVATGGLDRAVRSAERAYLSGKIGAEAYARAQAIASRASTEAASAGMRNVGSLGAQRAAYTQIGFQIQDVTQQVALGVSPFVILAQQGGQLASAFEQLFSSTGNAARGMGNQARAAVGNSQALGAANRATTALENKTAQLAVADAGAIPVMNQLTGAAGGNAAAMGVAAGATDRATAATSRWAIMGSAAARFFAGPFGSLLLAGVAIIGMQAARMGESADAMATAQMGADALGTAQSALGGIFDLTTGKIERQNNMLMINARLTAINLRAEALRARTDFNRTFEAGLRRQGGAFGDFSRWLGGRGHLADVEGQIGPGLLRPHIRRMRAARTPAERLAAADRALRESPWEGNTPDTDPIANLTNISREDWRKAIIDFMTASESDEAASAIIRSLDSRVLDPSLRRPRSGGRPRRPRRTPDQTEFGEDTADRITDITQRFTGMPPQVDSVRRALSDLDDIMSDVQRRRPPNYEALLAQARAARPIIQEGINRPYLDFIESQEESLRILGLQARGHEVEAEALQVILRLEREQGPLDQAKRAAILANVEAVRQEQQAVEVLHQRQQLYIAALGETRTALTATVQGVLGGDLASLRSLPRQLLESFNRLTAERLIEQLFGDAFRQLRDEVTGADDVRAANLELASTSDQTSTALQGLGAAVPTEALRELGNAARTAASDIANGADPAPGSGAAQNWAVWHANDLGPATSLLNWINTELTQLATTAPPATVVPNAGDDGQQVLVTGNRNNPLLTTPRDFFEKVLGRVLGEVMGSKLATTLSRGVARGLEGAAFGSMVAGALRLGGIRIPNGIAQAGGALLNQFPGVLSALGTSLPQLTQMMPLVSAGLAINQGIGNLLGNDQIKHGGLLNLVIGPFLTALFGSAKRGSATITSLDGVSTRGNSSSRIETSRGLATGVQDVLQQIADAFGGAIGSFSGSIGVRKDKFVVDPTGQGRTKGSGVLKFDTEAEAAAALLADLLSDGAILGISAAVQRALTSSTDISKAIREATKVEEVETLLKGLGGALEKQFRDFERQAAERVRIATKYGFDVLEIEKINAAERLKLEETVMESRVGSLKELLEDLDFGNLFEGSLVDKRDRLLEELAEAKAEAEAGVEGAAARLAQLSRDLIALSRDAFGTAGPEYGSDLELARSAAERVIELENARVKAAMDATNETNAQLNEANDQLAAQTALLRAIEAGIGGLGGILAGQPGQTGYEVDTTRNTQFE